MTSKLMCLFVLGLSAAVADAKSAASPEVGDVDAIFVVAHPTPPIWHVIHGKSDVVILGTVSPLPDELRWGTFRLETGIKGARRVILGAEPRSGYGWSVSLTPAKLEQFQLDGGQTLRADLPPALRARYLAALKLGGVDASRFDNWKAGAVGFAVLDHNRQSLGLTTAEPNATVKKIAQRQHVRSITISTRAELPTLDELPKLKSADQNRCLAESLDNLDRERASATMIAHAWALSDMRMLRANYEPPHSCEDLLVGDQGRRDAEVRATLAEIESDLTLGNRSVVLVDLSILFSPGFFDELQKTGAEVRPPRE
jgi:hypothetical protein